MLIQAGETKDWPEQVLMLMSIEADVDLRLLVDAGSSG
ncbi:hypothetical protein SynBIOSU31_01688 [Synechococcus sp. BIOS-U3-1]|nr:hypothetical protein SynBIOSU31_01688 [Synechococcus sp. BIOS-U3-1]